MTPPLLEVRGLDVCFDTARGAVAAVRDLSFEIRAGETLGLVGESGCGKSVSALALVGLLPPTGRVVGGELKLREAGQGEGKAGGEAVSLGSEEVRRLRGRRVAMIFQDPGSALNPVLTVGRQIRDVLRAHGHVPAEAVGAEVVRLLDRVGIPEPERRARVHPHTLSGGQRQRVMIAMALAARPRVLVADEPTTALDVTVQARIVALIREVQAETGMAVLWITHDLALAAGAVDRVAVMYAGRIVEEARVDALFRHPRHPYTRALVDAARELAGGAPGRRLTTIPGRAATPLAAATTPHGSTMASPAPAGCSFAPRCPRATARCTRERPILGAPGREDHPVACWHPHGPIAGAGPA